MMWKHFTRKETETTSINMSPLIDMVFILLIFFIVSTVFVNERGLEAKTSEQEHLIDEKEKAILEIRLTNSGRLFFGEREISLEEMSAMGREASGENQSEAMIAVGELVPTQLTVRVMDALHAEGIELITLHTER